MTLHPSPAVKRASISPPPPMTSPGAMQWIYARQAEGIAVESLLVLLCNAGWEERLVRRILGLPSAPAEPPLRTFRS